MIDVEWVAARSDVCASYSMLNCGKASIFNSLDPSPPGADTLIVYAKTAPDKGPHGITAFIIEKGMEVSMPRSARFAGFAGNGWKPMVGLFR